jgi:transcriptional regulator with XRE-family HTH domain
LQPAMEAMPSNTATAVTPGVIVVIVPHSEVCSCPCRLLASLRGGALPLRREAKVRARVAQRENRAQRITTTASLFCGPDGGSPARVPSASAARTLESIAANVRRLRLERGLTQERLAELAEVELRFLQRVERGVYNFGVAALVDLADALDVQPGLLLEAARLPPVTRGRPRRAEEDEPTVEPPRARSRAPKTGNRAQAAASKGGASPSKRRSPSRPS